MPTIEPSCRLPGPFRPKNGANGTTFAVSRVHLSFGIAIKLAIVTIVAITITLQNEDVFINHQVQAHGSFQLSANEPYPNDEFLLGASSTSPSRGILSHEQSMIKPISKQNNDEQLQQKQQQLAETIGINADSTTQSGETMVAADAASAASIATTIKPNYQEVDLISTPKPPSRTCYVCSTMDYENPSNNYCRFMKQRMIQMHQQHQLQYQHQHHQQPASSLSGYDQYPASIRLNQHSQNSAIPEKTGSPPHKSSGASGVEQQSQLNQDQIAPSTESSQYSSSISENNDKFVAGSKLATDGSYSNGYNPYNRSSTYANLTSSVDFGSSYYGSIRIRTCEEDENFCSVVSVVRIEYVNNELQSRFWALERNCSKSCNTGCMLIGEIVRLRVCSICCRKSNCNVGGASNSIHQSMRIGKDSEFLMERFPSIMTITIAMFAYMSLQRPERQSY